MSTLTINAVREMNYAQLVATINETNQPSGGARTVRRIIEALSDFPINRIIDVGCTTGFSTLKFARSLPGVDVVGLDINPEAVRHARRKAAEIGLKNASFVEASATAIPFPAKYFDVVYCNNVTAFIPDYPSAIQEYERLLSDKGVFAAVPVYYRQEPPRDVHAETERLVGAALPVLGKSFWLNAFHKDDLTLFVDEDYCDHSILTDEQIEREVENYFAQPELLMLDSDTRQALRERYLHSRKILNENDKYCGYSILMYQRNKD